MTIPQASPPAFPHIDISREGIFDSFQAMPCLSIDRCEMSEFQLLHFRSSQISSPQDRNRYLAVEHGLVGKCIGENLLGDLQNASAVLDIGCGSGNSTHQLLQAGNDSCFYIGVDDPDSAEFASKTFQGERISFEGAKELCVFPEPPKALSWEIITSFRFYDLIGANDQKTLLSAMYRALAPEGKIIIRTQGGLNRPYQFAVEKTKEKWSDCFKEYTDLYEDPKAQGFGLLLKESGFIECQMSLVNDSVIFATKQDMFLYFLQWLPELTAIKAPGEQETRSLRELFVEEVVDCYCEVKCPAGVKIEVSFPRILAKAKKPKFPAHFYLGLLA